MFNIQVTVTTTQVIIGGAAAVAPAASTAIFTLSGVRFTVISGVNVALPSPNIGGRHVVKSVTSAIATAIAIALALIPVAAVIPMHIRTVATTPAPDIRLIVARIATTIIAPTFTTRCTDAIVIPAIISFPAFPVSANPRGWPSWPVTPSASSDGVLVEVEVEGGRVVNLLAPTSGGGDGGGDDRKAAAATTTSTNAITTFTRLTPTIPDVPSPVLLHDTGGLPIVRAGMAPALLPVSMIMMHSRSTSVGGRGQSSGGPLGARQSVDHSPPPPTVVVVGAAWHSRDRPSVLIDTSSIAVPPRPGPASLLSPSQ